jgi:hypothetical protein
MELEQYINGIRKQIGKEEVLSASDGLCGRLTEEEIGEYIGREKAKELMEEHRQAMEEKYLKTEGWSYLQPVILNGVSKGLVIEEKRYMYTISEHKYVLVCKLENYELEMVMEESLSKRIPRAGEIDDYKEFLKENDRYIKMIGSNAIYEYLGVEQVGKTREYKKVVLRKKSTGEIMYYNGKEALEKMEE